MKSNSEAVRGSAESRKGMKAIPFKQRQHLNCETPVKTQFLFHEIYWNGTKKDGDEDVNEAMDKKYKEKSTQGLNHIHF